MEVDTDDEEDTPAKIKERVDEVREFLEREERRRLCYAAAMGRRWSLPMSTFLDMSKGPKKLELPERQFVYKTAEENDGVKTLLEMSLDALDIAYVRAGEGCLPEECFKSLAGGVPTAYEQNQCLCRVPKNRGEKRKRS